MFEKAANRYLEKKAVVCESDVSRENRLTLKNKRLNLATTRSVLNDLGKHIRNLEKSGAAPTRISSLEADRLRLVEECLKQSEELLKENAQH